MTTPGIDIPCMDCGVFYGDDCPRCGVDARHDLQPVFPERTVEEERRRIEDDAASERDQWKWAA